MGTSPKIIFLILVPICILVVLNFLVSFTPEMGFDALWYHLTLPKLWLLKKQWHFDGGLLYYSVMPRLTETIFIPLIQYTGTTGPKLLQFASALGTSYLIFKICRNLKLSKLWSFLAISLFYCTWLVSWESSSAYIDLFRGFLELFALYQFLFGSWVLGGVLLGLAIGTKWLALGSLIIFSLIFGPKILLLAIPIALPWFIIAFHFTGNFIYPIFSPIIHNNFLGFGTILKHLLFPYFFFTFPFDDFISPLVGLVFLIAIWALFNPNKSVTKIATVGILGSLSTLFIDPPSARFLIPYLPALVISAVFVVSSMSINLQKIFISLAILSSIIILGLRAIAFKKYIPFLLGRQTTEQFLTSHSLRLPDTFIDSDLFVTQNLSNQDKILIDKLHNLYYFPYNFDHTSWVKDQGGYDYLITTDQEVSSVKGHLIHRNELGIQIFKLTK